MIDNEKTSFLSQTKKNKQKPDTWSAAVADNENTVLVLENRGNDDKAMQYSPFSFTVSHM